MTLNEQLKSEIVDATKDKNEVRKNALKSILSAVQQSGDYTDKSIQSAALKLAKQLKESLEFFSEQKEKIIREELSVIESYCPLMAGEEEILSFINSHTHELRLLSDGARVGYVVKNIGKKVDGKVVKELLGLCRAI